MQHVEYGGIVEMCMIQSEAVGVLEYSNEHCLLHCVEVFCVASNLFCCVKFTISVSRKLVFELRKHTYNLLQNKKKLKKGNKRD